MQPEHAAFIQRQVQGFRDAGGRIEPVDRDQRQAVAKQYSNQVYAEKRAAGTLGKYDAMGSSRDATIRMALDSPNVLVARDHNGRIVGALGYRPKGAKNDEVNGVGGTGDLPGTGTALEHALAEINAPKGRGISGNAQNFNGTDSTGWHRAMGKRIGTDTNALGFPSSTWTPEDVQRVAAATPPDTGPTHPLDRLAQKIGPDAMTHVRQMTRPGMAISHDQTPTDGETMRWLNRQWGDNHAEYDAMRRAAGREFGVPGAAQTFDSDWYRNKVDTIDQEHGPALQQMWRSAYDQTQEALAAKGTKSMLLYRGVKTADDGRVAPITSWTTNRKTAEKYAGPDGHVLEQNVPSERILSSASTGGMGHRASGEVLVLSDHPHKTGNVAAYKRDSLTRRGATANPSPAPTEQGDPQAPSAAELKDAIDAWLGKAGPVYDSNGEPTGKVSDQQLNVIRKAIESEGTPTHDLSRGMAVPVNSYRIGQVIDLPPSSFGEPDHAVAYAETTHDILDGMTDQPYEPVVLNMLDRVPALNISDQGQAAFGENEWLVAGRFRVDHIENIDGIKHVMLSRAPASDPSEGISEPRGATGTPSGAANTGEALPEATGAPGTPDKATRALESARAEYERAGIDTSGITIVPHDDERTLAHGARDRVLVGPMFHDDDRMKAWAKEWHGYQVGTHQRDMSADEARHAIMRHELGHVLMRRAEERSPEAQAEVSAIPRETPTRREVNPDSQWDATPGISPDERLPRHQHDSLDRKSIYANESPYEWGAEALADAVTNGDNASPASKRMLAAVRKHAPNSQVPETRFPADHLGPWTSDDPATPYSVITSHEPDGGFRSRHFPTYDAADEYAKSTDPDKDGSMRPNLPERVGTHPNYERGYYWPKQENRYASIHRHGYDPEPETPWIDTQSPMRYGTGDEPLTDWEYETQVEPTVWENWQDAHDGRDPRESDETWKEYMQWCQIAREQYDDGSMPITWR